MKNIHYLFFIVIFLFVNNITAQDYYGINFPNYQEGKQKCQYFSQSFQNKPKEVKFSIVRENNKLFFEVNDKNWFSQLFSKGKDGIAIDIVPKSLYDCNTYEKPRQVKGLLLKPVFAKQLRRNLKSIGNNRYRTFAGTVPDGLLDDDLEFNILFLNNNTFCNYYTIYNLESYPWELLDMGIYLDSLVYKNKKVLSTKMKEVTHFKNLTFVIPFQKNKSEYLPKDIKPMYDSLRLTDFHIKKINIKAYASVEGSLERNLILQNKRANSIAQSLQTYQKPNIITEISTSENWVEFLNDISNTKFKYLTSLSKKQVKSKLVGSLSKKLETYLKNHRKAVVTLSLERKDVYKEKEIPELIVLFNDAVASEKVKEALLIQNSIFNKLKEKVSPSFFKKLTVPKQIKYIDLLNKNSIYNYFLNKRQALIATHQLQQLEQLDPTNKKVKYNIVVIKFFLWKNNALKESEQDFKTAILDLKSYGISQDLIDRMMVNFHIIKAKKSMRKRDYRSKDTSVDYILNTYKNFHLSNYDYLSLAQFLTYYSKPVDAQKILENKVKEITINEDLLFYYLNLTIVQPEITQTDAYRTTMLNAININKKRFCKLFNPSGNGGVTFQLLENDFLRKTYCESCTNN